MARTNVKRKTQATYTHEGGRAVSGLTPEQQLTRSVNACFLWEDTFYEDGESIADRIMSLAGQVSPEFLADTAIKARHEHNLRHAPLLLLCALIKHGSGSRIAGDTIERVVSRVDELPELVSLYLGGSDRKKAKKALAAQLKLGLARAFDKFDEYQFAKYDRDTGIKLRDVLFMVHAHPRHNKSELYRKIVDGELATPDTWEVGLSSGADKKETFERLIRDGKLGYLALIRNLRNMQDAGVDRSLVDEAILARKGAQRVLPFRFLMAARMAPSFEKVLDQALVATVKDLPKFDDETLVLVDTSGSMGGSISYRSNVKRSDAAAMLAALVDGNIRCFAFATTVKEVPHRLGVAGVDAFQRADVGWGTNIGLAVKTATAKYPKAKRIIVITDEQSHDNVASPKAEKLYMINVASYQNGVGYGRWTHIDGFSESTVRYIMQSESGWRTELTE